MPSRSKATATISADGFPVTGSICWYCGYGASAGAPRSASLKADALALYDAVAAAHGGPVDVIGRSIGSGVASHVAAHRPVARLALITPFDSLANVAQGHYPWLPVRRRLLREHYSPSADLAEFEGRLLVLRAGRDTVIPSRHIDALLANVAGTPRVAEFPDAGHNDIQLQPGYGETLAGFFRTEVGAPVGD